MPFDAEKPSPDPIDVEVGLRLRTLRKSRGVSQSALADALGLTFQQVQKYERGTNRISASMLVKSARALGVNPIELLPVEGDTTPRSPRALAIIAMTRGAEDLVEAYASIAVPRLRRAVLVMAKACANLPDPKAQGAQDGGEGADPSDSETEDNSNA